MIEVSTGEPSHAVRKPRHISSSDPELFKIDVQVRGRGVIRQGEREAEYRPRDFTLIDLARPSLWAFQPASRVVAVTFPRSLLPLGRADLDRLTGERLTGDSGLGALVSSFTRRFPGRLDDLTVAEHLADPALSPRSIAAAHFVSVRLLHRLFESEQSTVADLIRRRRLERCHQDLLDPSQLEVPVAALGARWGFTSAAHFGRLFQTAYGVPPATFRRACAPGQAG